MGSLYMYCKQDLAFENFPTTNPFNFSSNTYKIDFIGINISTSFFGFIVKLIFHSIFVLFHYNCNKGFKIKILIISICNNILSEVSFLVTIFVIVVVLVVLLL